MMMGFLSLFFLGFWRKKIFKELMDGDRMGLFNEWSVP